MKLLLSLSQYTMSICAIIQVCMVLRPQPQHFRWAAYADTCEMSMLFGHITVWKQPKHTAQEGSPSLLVGLSKIQEEKFEGKTKMYVWGGEPKPNNWGT